MGEFRMTRWWGGCMLMAAVGLAQADSAVVPAAECESAPDQHSYGEIIDHSPPREAGAETVAVGGCISGLRGSDLMLIDNESGQIVKVNSDQAHYRFLLHEGNRYSIEVLSPPIGPLQDCVIDNASGTAHGNRVNDLDVTCNPVDEIFRGQFEDDIPAPLINQF
jgi:hypothetical protein